MFSAAQVLPANLLSSPYYTVGNQVGLDNFQYVFKVDTRWGTFAVKGTDLMRVRAREIAATAKLAEIDSAGTVVDAAGRTALKPLATAKDLVTAPGKTIGDTFKGVGNLFGSVDAAMSATDPHKEGMVASVTGGATARRKLAFDLRRRSQYQLSAAPRRADAARHGERHRRDRRQCRACLRHRRRRHRHQRRRHQPDAARWLCATRRRRSSRRTAARRSPRSAYRAARSDAFYANPNLSPTDKSSSSPRSPDLGATGGREIFIAGAANAKSIEMGFFYRRQAELIADYDEKVAPVNAFVRAGGAPMLQTGEGHGQHPAGRLSLLVAAAGRSGRGRGSGGELWITGRASQRATSQLAALGWTLVPKAGGRLGE